MSYFGEEAGGTRWFPHWLIHPSLVLTQFHWIPLPPETDLSTVVCHHCCRPRGSVALGPPVPTAGSVGFTASLWTGLGKPPANLFSLLHTWPTSTVAKHVTTWPLLSHWEPHWLYSRDKETEHQPHNSCPVETENVRRRWENHLTKIGNQKTQYTKTFQSYNQIRAFTITKNILESTTGVIKKCIMALVTEINFYLTLLSGSCQW